MKHMLKIGAGCSVDITLALSQMAEYGELDYLVLDYVMEHGIAKMAAARQADPTAGFATGFVGPDLSRELPRLLTCGTKIITSAGGLNPVRCAELLKEQMHNLGLKAKIAAVHGDDVRGILDEGFRDMYTGAPVPKALASSNAYLGATPIAAALARGADIVVAGRVVDSALSLGPLLHEFRWSLDDYDLIAAGSIVGHLLECGAQTSGGIHTDWRAIDFVNSSFPIAEVRADGEVIITKAPGSGGQVSVGTVSEQLTYEIGDPQRYFLPDVTVDFSQVSLTQVGTDRVRLRGARGCAPNSSYKVCSIEHVGWRAVVSNVVAGGAAREKASKTVAAMQTRSEIVARREGWAPFDSITAELIGNGNSGNPGCRDDAAQAVVYRLVADHRDREATEAILRINGASFVSMAPGTCFLGAEVRPRMKVWSHLLDKSRVTPQITVDGDTFADEGHLRGGFSEAEVPPNPPLPRAAAPGGRAVRLEEIALTRSGDKGDTANIGVIAREPRFLPYIVDAMTTEAMELWYAAVLADGPGERVERFELPGIGGLNFLLHHSLDGGAVASRRFDDMGKSFGQQLLDFPVKLPSGFVT